eukprot:10020776-Prorocentrum_lima.AAC.1
MAVRPNSSWSPTGTTSSPTSWRGGPPGLRHRHTGRCGLPKRPSSLQEHPRTRARPAPHLRRRGMHWTP